ncbi:MAG: hypothetical protein Q9162_002222 [Coniocarpon cinnabarinum]
MPPSAKRRKLQNHGVEEVKFDFDARQQYLTGFRRRKQARIQHAQKVAAEKGRQAKIEDRKQLREKRKQEVEEHVKAVNEGVKNAEKALQDSDDEKDDTGHEQASNDAAHDSSTGVDAVQEEQEYGHEDEYVDEEKHTTVTVEPLNPELEEDEHSSLDEDDIEHTGETDIAKRNGRTHIHAPSKRSPGVKKSSDGITAKRKEKPKKASFHYESKGERKLAKLQQVMKKRKAAATRRAKRG